MTLVLFVGFIAIWNLVVLLSLLFVPIKLRRSEQNIVNECSGLLGHCFQWSIRNLQGTLFVHTTHLCTDKFVLHSDLYVKTV